MLLVSGSLRVALLTIHEPLAHVAALVTEERVLETLQTVADGLQSDFGIAKPRIAVLGLNPHAGDGGVIGDEEIEIIQPALEAAQASGLNVDGPFPADGFFGHRDDKDYDAVLAMYHDQGHIPVKVYGFEESITVNLGLPFIRTSVDHGTAFDIAWQGKADPTSMAEAIHVAADLASGTGLATARS